jgi:iron complex outermembrane receptor protein
MVRTAACADERSGNQTGRLGESTLNTNTCRIFRGAILTALGATAVARGEPASQSPPSSGGLEEIIVTATKRDETLLKVPMTVRVLSSADIQAAGITRSSAFLNSTPNVTFQEDNTGETFVNIRGQTSTRNSDPNVGMVVDGVALTSMRNFNQDLYDIQQIEVLKGPQSALYGRNAAAGAIVITTKMPSDEFEGNATVGLGNFDTSRFTGSVSGPITSTLKYRASASFRDTQGPFTNSTTGEKVMRTTPTLGRLRLLYEPNEKLSIDTKLGFSVTHGGTLAYNAQLVGLPLGGFDGTKLDANNADIPWISNVNGVYDEKYYDGSVKIDYDLDFAKFTSITAVNSLDSFFGGDLTPYLPDTGQPGALIASYAFIDKNYSQEFRLTSPSNQRLRWQVGLYGLRFDRDQYNELNVDTLGAVPSTRNRIDGPDTPQPTAVFGHQDFQTTSYAVFGNIQYDIADRLRLNVAGRYDDEERKYREATPDEINPLTGTSYNLCVQLTGLPVGECKDSKKFNHFAPKVSLSYDITPDVSTYVSYGEGFKSGGFNPKGSRQALIDATEAAGLPTDNIYLQDQYDKEVSKSWELGAKLRLLDRRLSINAAVFDTTIDGAQQFQFIPTVGLQTTISVDKVKSKGFDFDFAALLPAEVELFGGYGYTDATVDKFSGNPAVEGNDAPGTLKYNATLGITKAFDVADRTKLTPRVEWNRLGPIWWDIDNTPGTKRDPIDLVKARITLGRDNWEISAYGDNLLNEKYYQEVVPILSVFTVNFRAWTRTYGLEGTIRF